MDAKIKEELSTTTKEAAKADIVAEIKANPEKVSDIVVTPTEVTLTPVAVAETFMTLDEIRAIPLEHYPILMYCDGGSLFGWLIRKVDKASASHFQILYGPDQIASQWFYFTTFPVSHIATYNTKMIWNPEWTPTERKVLIKAIKDRLLLSKWTSRYDVWGVIGEAINAEWMQRKAIDFCSEAVGRFLKLVDPVFTKFLEICPSPTPRQLNVYTKTHNPPYKVYGRFMVDD